jgi:hypothetical protein
VTGRGDRRVDRCLVRDVDTQSSRAVEVLDVGQPSRRGYDLVATAGE